ncbi:major capsid protein [Ilumatobacter sp.]|uniref:major capsid protein n=1 Tax=Ilumatobacter sp. TaxID=1967498 RepID=UPI003751CB5A
MKTNKLVKTVNGMTVDELLDFHRQAFGETRMEDKPAEGDALTAADAAVLDAPATTGFDAMDDETLAARLEELTAEFDSQYSEGSRDIATLTALADDVDALRAEQTARADAAAEADMAAEALASRVRPAVEAAEAVEAIAEEGTASDTEAPAAGEALDVATPADAPLDAPVSAEPLEEMAGAPASAAAITASARRAAPASIAGRAPRPAPARGAQRMALAASGAKADGPKPSLVAAIDFATSTHPEVRADNEVTLLQLAASFNDRAASMPVGKNRPRIGRLNMPFAENQTLTSDAKHNAEVLRASVDNSKVTAESLLAAGGWCAPSQPVFEQFDLGPDADNLFDVPTFGGDVRAGIMFPSMFQVGDADDAFWAWSETADINAVGGVAFTGAIVSNVATLNFASDHGLEVGNAIRVTGSDASGFASGDYYVVTVVDSDTVTVATDDADDAAIAGTGTPFKHSMRIPCPTWSEARMGADGLSVTHGNLSNEAWPELTADFLRVALASHRRFMSSRRIARVVNDTVTVIPADPGSDVAADLLQIIELQAVDMRSQYRVGANTVVEALIPEWIMPVLRANMAKRAGVENMMSVPDSMINGWLTQRGIKPQYTPDWQPLYSGAPATNYPAAVQVAMWFGGSYFSLNGGRIDLGVQRDPDMNAYNDYTAAWFEEFWTIARRGPAGRKWSYTLTGKIDGEV